MIDCSQWRKTALFSQRSVLTLMALTGLVNANLMRLCFNITISIMVNDTSNKPKFFQHTQSTMMDATSIVSGSSNQYYWSEETTYFVKLVFCIGYGLLHIPGSYLSQKYGGKTIFNLALLMNSVCALLTPTVAVNGGANGLIMLRCFICVCEVLAYPALVVLMCSWIPEDERGRVSSIVFCGGHIGTIIWNLLTGFVPQYIEAYAIRSYILGVVGILWSIAFQFLVYNTPATHPRISVEEKEHLREKIGNLVKTKRFCQIPWTSMLSSESVMALMIIQYGYDWMSYNLTFEMPHYLKVVLGLNDKELAVYTTIPLFVSCSSSIASGIVCDYIVHKQLVTLTRARKIFTAIGVLGSAILSLQTYRMESDRAGAVIFLTLTMSAMGCYYTGAQANFLDICPNYGGILMGLVNGTGAVCGFIVPNLTNRLTRKSEYWEWDALFDMSVVIMSVTVIWYSVWGSAEVRYWNYNTDRADLQRWIQARINL